MFIYEMWNCCLYKIATFQEESSIASLKWQDNTVIWYNVNVKLDVFFISRHLLFTGVFSERLQYIFLKMSLCSQWP